MFTIKTRLSKTDITKGHLIVMLRNHNRIDKMQKTKNILEYYVHSLAILASLLLKSQPSIQGVQEKLSL